MINCPIKRVIVLLGGATAKIGDPSGKSTERPLLEDQVILQNCKGIEENVRRVFANHAEICNKGQGDKCDDLVVLNNLEWYKNQGVLEYLARHGRHFRVEDMFRTRSVKSRIGTEEGLSFTEFSYQTFQVKKA